MSSLLRILYLFYSVAHALPTESSYDLFDLPLTDSSSMTLDPTNLDFWNGGGDLQSQLDQFTISSAGAAPLSNIEPGSTDLLGSSLSFPNDPFQVVNSGCQANAIDSNEVAQDLFAISGAQIDARSDSKSFSAPKNSRRSDLTFGDILGDHEHVCPGEEVAACCATGGPEIVIPRPTQTRVRQGCITWTQWESLGSLSCLNEYRYCCIDVDEDGDGIECNPAYPESQLEEKQVPNGFCKAQA